MVEASWRSNVRARREQAGLSASDVARQIGITRQALHSIETDAYVPNTLIALQLAKLLSCTVEDLFTLIPPQIQARLMGIAALPVRVRLAQVGKQWLAFPLLGHSALGESADGMAGLEQDGQIQVKLFGKMELARRTAVVAGCDPALGLLARQAGLTPNSRMLWQSASSLEALRAVARGEAHAAGIHLWDAVTGESNEPFVQREWPGRVAHLFTLWTWEQGLMVQTGNPRGITGLSDLLRQDIRLANREEGAGSRMLLDAWLDAAQISQKARRKLAGYSDEVTSPLMAAQRVASGQADAAPGPRSAALALGLHFIPLQTERFDLVVPGEFVSHPGITALLGVAGQSAFRAELTALGGYNPAHAGEHWRTTA